MLRSVRLYNFIECEAVMAQIEAEARRHSAFEANDMKCRELLLEYWLKNPQDIPPADVNTLRELRMHFAGTSTAPPNAGQNLKRINTLLQLDWMLGDPDQLERDFSAYLSLLRANHLDRMVLFGGQNAIETTAQWGQLDAADRLLGLWLSSAVSQNDIAPILEFAAARRAKGRFWTVARLMEVILKDPRVSGGERFMAQTLHCVTLARLHEMIRDPNHGGRTELDVAQTRWALAHGATENLLAETEASMKAARQAYAAVERHTRQHQTLKRELDMIEQNLPENKSAHDDAETADDN
ncbi:MAG: hypothetical protein A2Y76_09735 [Planctomycetes bacterium RBG_13_60_9]|nr:MAG: hypothetical protein A2Y76_09735 [Planctomycetes bacterium RBG_13_60_9]